MQTPKVCHCFPQSDGERYMPSNGTEGMIFTDAFCANCIHEKWMHTMEDGDKKCEILSNSMVENSVPEWIYNEGGWPVCTHWQRWDWGFNDENDNFNEPPEPPTNDPNQLCLPFELNEILNNTKEKEHV